MVKVQAIMDFTYKNYDKIENLESTKEKVKGKIFYGDIFIVTNDEALYLAGENKNNIEAVRVLEVLPDKLLNVENNKVEKVVDDKPKKRTTKKTTKINKI